MFGVTEDAALISYVVNHKHHLNMNNNVLNMSNSMVKSESNNSFKGNEGLMKHLAIKEPILVNSHSTHYYGKVFNNNF